MKSSPSQENPLGILPVNQLLARFAIPSIIAMLVSALYNIVDQFFIGRSVGMLGNAATNVAFPLTITCTAISLMCGIGGAANFNLSLGSGEKEEATRYAGNAVFMLAAIGVLLCLTVRLFLKPLMIVFGATPDVLDYSLTYTGITSLGFPFLILTTGGSNLIRADGSPRFSMMCTLTDAVLNTILDPLFIFGFHMGMAGAALATIIGQIISGIMVIVYLTRFKTVHLSLGSLVPVPSHMKAIAALGMAPFFNQMAMMVVQIVMNNILRYYGAQSHYGSEIPLACAGIITKVNMIFFSLVIGLSQGLQPIVSFNYGAKKLDRVSRTFRLLLTSCMTYSTVLWAVAMFAPMVYIRIFTQDAALTAFSEWSIRIYMAASLLFGAQLACQQTFIAIGDSKTSLFLALLRKVILLIPLIYVLPNLFENKVFAVFVAEPIADTIAVCTTVTLFLLSFRKMKRELGANA